MARRKPVNRNTDERIFRNTAERTREINVNPSPMRGGTRL